MASSKASNGDLDPLWQNTDWYANPTLLLLDFRVFYLAVLMDCVRNQLLLHACTRHIAIFTSVMTSDLFHLYATRNRIPHDTFS